jgi:hypothetical protein
MSALSKVEMSVSAPFWEFGGCHFDGHGGDEQPTHRRRGVELLGDRNERDRLGIKGLDQFGEIGERPGQPVDLVDDDDVYPAGVDVLQ